MTSTETPAPAHRRIASRDDAERLVAELLAAMEGLLEVLDTETRLVRQGRLAAAGALGHEKRDRAAVYTGLALSARAAIEDIGRYAPRAAEDMKRRHELFKAEAQINLAVLSTARQVAEDLVRSVAEEVGTRQAPVGYGRAGAMEPPARSTARGIAVDTAL
jgi:hypothetical protein